MSHTSTEKHNVNPKSIGVLERDWETALVLSIFLGLLGIDQFYLGKTGKGILKLFTLGLFGILWVIDIIMIATKSVRGIVWREGQKQGNWFDRHKVLAIFIALFIIGMVLIAANGDQTNTSSKNITTASTSKTPSQEASPTPKRQIKGKATTLGAGTFTGGKDVAVGLYDAAPGAGQSGNFIVHGSNEYNEILGNDSSLSEVPKVRVKISRGDQVQISGLSSVTFTPVKTPFVTKHKAVNLYAGTFVVGEDVGSGRYVVTPSAGQSGNFIVHGSNEYNEILGGDANYGGVSKVTVSLGDDDQIEISGLSKVTFTPTN